jgi:hypothetical protein
MATAAPLSPTANTHPTSKRIIGIYQAQSPVFQNTALSSRFISLERIIVSSSG